MRLAFLSAVILGFLVHMYMFTNKLPNHDDIICLFYNDATVTSGRWFLSILIALSSNFSLPWVNGVISIAALGLTCAVLVKLFSIRKPLEIILCSFSLVAFPSVTNAFGFMFTADGYMIGFFMAALAAYLVDKRRWGFLPATVLLMLAAATYQATLCLFVAIVAVRGMQILLLKELDDRAVFCRLISYVGTAIAAVILYVISSKIALAVTGLEMEAYVGLDEMGKLSLLEIPRMFLDAYQGFFAFVFRTSGVHLGLWLSITHLIMGLVIVFLILYISICRGLRTKAQRILLILVALALPMLLNSASFFGTSHVHAIMMYGIVMIYWLIIVLYDAATEHADGSEILRISGWIAAIAVFLASSGWGVYANQCYLKLQLKYENSYALTNRIVNRIESFEDYVPGMPVAFIGEPSKGNYKQAKDGNLGSLGDDEGFGGASEYSFIYDDRHMKDFIKWYVGVKFDLLDEGALKNISMDERVEAMPCYPDQDSVQIIDGVLVVKAGPTDDA